MTENISTTAEGDRYDGLYREYSPEYTLTVSRWGRMLTPAQVEDILSAHGFSVEDLLDDSGDPITGGATSLPEQLDAAMLYAWLGY